VRFACRNGWIVADPVSRLEADERPHPIRRRQRVLGRDEIGRLLAACLPRYRPLLATALYSGLRISELLGLARDDVDFVAGVIHVRAQLSRAHRGAPARRVPPKTPSAVRDVPLVPPRGDAARAAAHLAVCSGQRLGLRHRPRHPARAPQRRAPSAGPRPR
jgi:integrase